MPLKTDLTSADLGEIRESALGAADPLGVAAELAEAADSGSLADKNDAGYALTLAAEIAESRSKLDAAEKYVDRALDAFGDREDTQVASAHALHARILFRTGHADEAMAELEPLRAALTQYPDAAAYVAAALAVGGRARIAEEWLTEAVKSVMAERGQGPEPTNADEAGLLFFLLQQRHRIRHLLGLSHDTNDTLAERLETRLANSTAREAETPADDLLFFPQAEYDKLVAQWPALTEAYGSDFDAHRAHLEKELVRLGGTGLLTGTVAGLTAFAGKDGDPSDAKTRADYARQVKGTVPWPPERNAACWCGSGTKYKKCCLPRGRA